MKNKYHFVNWFPDWRGFHFYKLNPEKSSYYLIYEWFLFIGFWEIRKWQRNPAKALKIYQTYWDKKEK